MRSLQTDDKENNINISNLDTKYISDYDLPFPGAKSRKSGISKLLLN